MDRFMEFWEEANKVISRVPFTENSHREVIRLQGLALKELDAMEQNLGVDGSLVTNTRGQRAMAQEAHPLDT